MPGFAGFPWRGHRKSPTCSKSGALIEYSRLVSITIRERPFAVRDVYLLIVHEPRPHPAGLSVPVNVLIVHALTLLRADLPQPGAARVYRCLTEFPGRVPGCVVPLSTLTYELDDGRLWPRVADRQAVTDAVVGLALAPAQGQRPCRSLPMSVDHPYDAILAGGPYTAVRHDPACGSYHLDGPVLGTSHRQALLNLLADRVAQWAPRPEAWAGGDLIPLPDDPAVMPYQPHGT
jgi:hypothetical protein